MYVLGVTPPEIVQVSGCLGSFVTGTEMKLCRP